MAVTEKAPRSAPSDAPGRAAERMRRYRQTPKGKLEVQATNYARVELVKLHREEFEALRNEFKAGVMDEAASA